MIISVFHQPTPVTVTASSGCQGWCWRRIITRLKRERRSSAVKPSTTATVSTQQGHPLSIGYPEAKSVIYDTRESVRQENQQISSCQNCYLTMLIIGLGHCFLQKLVYHHKGLTCSLCLVKVQITDGMLHKKHAARTIARYRAVRMKFHSYQTKKIASTNILPPSLNYCSRRRER